jgi:hypothetical protein
MKRMRVVLLRTACNWHDVVRLQALRATLDEQPLGDRVGTISWPKSLAVIEDELIDIPHTSRETTFAHVA